MAAPVLQFKRGLLANLPGLRVGEPGFTTDSYDLYVGIDSSANNNKFFGSHRYWTKGTASTGSGVNLVEGTSNGTSYITLKSPDSLAGIVTYTLPATPVNGDVLTTDANGVLSWTSALDELAITNLVSGIGTFSNNVAFTTTTDNTLGDVNTGAVQIVGGVGIAKNVTIGAGLSVTGQSHFIGTATFYGGQINLGDSDTDDIVVAGEFKSNLIPSDDATYNLGNISKRWNNASFAGVGTFATGAVVDAVQIGISNGNTIDTTIGKLTLNSIIGLVEVAQHLDVLGDLDVTGNVYIGGTTVTLRGTDVFIENKDIVLGYTTTSTPNDTTANHAGVAIASTEGTPLANFDASGINTLPSTYKQMMWFKSGTLGFSTDAFGFNYGVAIGTTTMANGVRLAVGSGVTVSDTSVSATTFYGSVVGNVSSADQVKTVDAGSANADYYLTFVNSNNGSSTNEIVYTDDGVYYNPGTNTFTTQYGRFTGNLIVDGDIKVGGNDIQASDGTTAITLSGADVTIAGDLQITGNDIKSSTGATAITLAANDVTIADDLTVQGNLYVNGSTTQVNTTALTVEDRTIELGRVDGAVPSSSTTWDLGVLFNYNASGAKKSAVVWEHSATRFQFASVLGSDTDGTDVNTPQLSVTTFAPIEIGSLWVTDCAGTSQVISCTGTTRNLENITIDAGTF
jgi:hypothetical protein